MAIITPRRRATTRWAALTLFVVAALGLLGISSAVAADPWYGSNYFAVADQDGANDVPGQVDVTMMGRDDHLAGVYRIFMAWDSIDQWTGTGQTGDACALFDSDGDGNINFVVCGQIHNPDADPATVELENAAAPYAFTCSDKKNDRCTTPSPEPVVFGTDITAGPFGFADATHQFDNLIKNTDPFGSGALNGPGTSYPDDSVLEVAIAKSFLPTGATLVNVCSYPSAGNGGNNNPFDCVVSPGGGFLKIVKNTGAATTSDFTFTLSRALVDGSTTATVTETTGSPAVGTTGNLGIVMGAVLTITETQPSTDWVLQSVACTLEGGGSTGSADVANNKITGVAIESGKVTTCTFTDRTKPTLTLAKVVTNDNGGTTHADQWTLTATPTTGSAISGAGTLVAGTPADDAAFGPTTATPGVVYTLSESAVTGYSQVGAWSCTGGTFTSPNKIELAYGQDVTCTVTNDDNASNLTLIKNVLNDNGGTAVATGWTMSATGTGGFTGQALSAITTETGFSSSASTGAKAVTAGVQYTLSESTVSGYTAGTWACTGGTFTSPDKVTLGVGGSATCRLTNDDDKAAPAIRTAQGWILTDTAVITGLRTGASDASTATMTFRLWSTKSAGNVCSDQVGDDLVVTGVTTTSITTPSGITVTSPDTYYWTVAYSGDQRNAPFATMCGSESTTISAVEPAP